MQGQGPTLSQGGELVKMNLIIASTNVLAADIVTANAMGFESNEIDTFLWAWKAGMKPSKIDDIEIVGEKLDDVKKHRYFETIGRFIALLHKNGHIHGDITTSNIIITDSEDIFLIDFGLHNYSDSIEDKSVDLHLLKRVLISSHGTHWKLCFDAFLEGYRLGYNDVDLNECKSIIKNISVIETRGRYVKKEERL